MRGRAWWALGWAAGAAAVAMAAGGAAARPDAWLLGAPTALALVTGAAVLAGLAVLTRGAAGAVLAGLWPVVLLVVLGVRLPGVAALAGRPIAVLVLAAAIGALARARPRWAGAAFLPVVALVYGLAAARVQAQVGPEGDEPHYLMVADSLLRDHDLSLERDYAEGRYRAFHPAPLEPHYRVRGRGGAIYSLHAVGLSVLLLPAYALAGYAGASFFMALLAVWLAHETRALLRTWVDEAADTTAWIVALSPPLVHYAGLVFTEIPAALIVAAGLRHGRGETSRRAAAVAGIAVALLPWLNVRYAVLTVILILFALSARPSRTAMLAWVVPSLVSAVAIALFHFHLYGFFDPRRVYGRRPELALSGLPIGLPGLLFDQEFGLLAYAPVFALAVPGVVALWRRSRRAAVAAIAMTVAVILTAGAWPMWRGGFNPPARFLVPVVPALALAVGARLRAGLGAAAALLVGWSLWAGAVGTWDRALVHRDRDGTGAEEWTRLLPGYVQDESPHDRARLTWEWAAALLAAALAGRAKDRRVTAAGLAGASLALVAAAGIASRVSSARTEGRDAVRVIGRPALSVPGWTKVARAGAAWTTDVLPWGPAYEPHRSPDGAVIGGRLMLPDGTYRIEIGGEIVPSSLPLPTLQAGPDTGPRRITALVAGAGGLLGSFVVPEGERATSLTLRGGGPLILNEIRLEQASTFPPPTGLKR